MVPFNTSHVGVILGFISCKFMRLWVISVNQNYHNISAESNTRSGKYCSRVWTEKFSSNFTDIFFCFYINFEFSLWSFRVTVLNGGIGHRVPVLSQPKNRSKITMKNGETQNMKNKIPTWKRNESKIASHNLPPKEEFLIIPKARSQSPRQSSYRRYWTYFQYCFE